MEDSRKDTDKANTKYEQASRHHNSEGYAQEPPENRKKLDESHKIESGKQPEAME